MTTKQQNLAKLRIENPKMPKGKLVELGGYGEVVQNQPSKALDSKGYKEALAEYGLTEELITTSLVSDIKEKPKHRFLELNLGAEILGMKDRDMNFGGQTTNNITQIIINPPREREAGNQSDS